MHSYACALLVSTFIAFAAAGGAAAARPIAVQDIRTISDVEEPALAPDASRVAFITIRNDVRALWIVDTATRKRSALAADSPAVPRWSPDGRTLAYLAQDRSGHAQIYVWDGAGAARKLTDFHGGAVDFEWSPSGASIAAAVSDAQTQPAYYFAGDTGYTLSAPEPPEHLWIVDAKGGERRLTRGPWTIPHTDAGGIFSSQFAWNPAGTSIVFARLPNTQSGENEYSTLWSVDVRSGALRKLTAHSAFEFAPSYAIEGRRWIYSYPRNSNYLANNTILVIENGQTREITKRFDRNAAGALWLPGDRRLLVCANDRTRVGTWIFDLQGNYSRVPLGGLNMLCDSYQDGEYDSGIAASVSRSGAIAFVASNGRRDREIYFVPSPYAAPKRLTGFNDALTRLDAGSQREISWRSSDGYTDYGVITFPPNVTAGRKYPIVVDIHGGPGETSIQDFDAPGGWPRSQLIAARGYIVFEPNYRGSDDAGNAFLLAVAGDTVRGPADDIMTGLRAVEALPQADPSRVAVCGWSYGGQMTSWLITQYHFWRAAVSGAAVNNEIEEYAFSESNVQDRYYQKTSPFAPGGDRIYRSRTPITYAADVTTPTLIWSTSGDPVVPVTQSYEFYHALREHNVPVRFAVFPGNTHGPADEPQTEALTGLWLAWLDRYLKR